jgi:hypothetical protein
MNIFFNFVKTLNKMYMFKVGLSRFMEIQASVIVNKKLSNMLLYVFVKTIIF